MRNAPAPHRGLSLVELLVGVTVGLFVVGGATKLVVDNLNSNRRNVLETRVNQDLRAAADLVARDLRRSGYWQNAASGLWSTAGTAPTPNPHRNLTVGGTSDLGTIAYSYAKDNDDTLDNNEQFGYSVSAGVLNYQTASGVALQPITDPNTLSIAADGFKIIGTQRIVELFSYCSCITQVKCTAAQFAAASGVTPAGTYYATRPYTVVREYEVRIKGTSATDANVTREIRETVRVRNDEIVGVCPNIV
jgi:prepilin peptidase dependent protein B